MLKKLFFIFLVLSGILTQKTNTAECPKCEQLQNELIVSFAEQAQLLRQNIQLAQENKVLWERIEKLGKDFDKLTDLNGTLLYMVDTLLNNRHPQKSATRREGFCCLQNESSAQLKGFYFTQNIYNITASQDKLGFNRNQL